VWVTVAIVWPCPLGVEQYAAVGRQVKVACPDCPGCGRVMVLWSGYARWVRVGGRAWRVWVRRARCGPCRVAMAFKLLESAQDRWRAVNGPHLVALVRAGARFDKGVMVERPDEVQEVAA